MAVNRRISIVLVFFFLLASGSQLALDGYPWSDTSRDRLLTLTAQYAAAASEGALLSGWLPDFNHGAGSPYALFDASLALPAAAMLAGSMSHLNALKTLAFILLVIGTIGMYRIGKHLFGPWGALAAATLFLYLPPRIAQLTVFGDLSGFAAGALFPWCLMAYLHFLDQPSRFRALSLAVFSGLCAAMDLTALPALACIPLLGWAFLSDHKMFRHHMTAVLFLSLGAAAAASIWLPPFLCASSIQLGQPGYTGLSPETEGVYLSQLLSFNWGAGVTRPGPNDDAPFQLGILHIALFLLACAGFYRRAGAAGRERLVIPILTVFFLLMITPLSASLWHASTALKLFRYPWRLLWIPATFISLLGAGIAPPESDPVDDATPGSRILSAFFIAVLVFQLNGGFYTHAGWGDPDAARYTKDAVKALAEPPHWLTPFQPPWTETSGHSLFRLSMQSDKGSVTRYFNDATDHLAFECRCVEPTGFKTNILYFPNWRLKLDGKQVLLKQPTDSPDISFVVPAGQHRVDLTFHRFPPDAPERFLPWAACTALLLLICTPLFRRIEPGKNHHDA